MPRRARHLASAVDFLTHELGTEGVVADGGIGHVNAVRWPLHALEALEVLLQQRVIGRQQQGKCHLFMLRSRRLSLPSVSS